MAAELSGSVTCLLTQLRGAHASDAEQELFYRYFGQLVHLARERLAGKLDAMVDEEDIALSALNSFIGRMQSGEFPELQDRTGLWRLLVTITARKAINAVKWERADKRNPAKLDHVANVELLIGSEPLPSAAAELADEMRRLFDLLGDDTLRRIVGLTLEGYTNAEIAQLLDVAESTVYRKLDRIRSEWEKMVQP
jgi:RNA polymerase sigma factor (sigma-70 family)